MERRTWRPDVAPPRHGGDHGGAPRGSLAICNDYETKVLFEAYLNRIQNAGLEAAPWQGQGDLPLADHIHISDMAPTVRLDGAAAVLTPMRWSFPPTRPGAGPVFNFRSEGRRFSAAQRCLIPASAFFEFTAPARSGQKRKDRWRFGRADGDWMGIAGLWRQGEGNHPPVFTMLTCEPGQDVAAIHKRQVVVVEPQNWTAWLRAERPEDEVLRPSPPGTFNVAREAHEVAADTPNLLI